MGDAELFEGVRAVFTGDQDIGGVLQDHVGVFVDDGGDLKPGAVLEMVGFEIDRPDMIATLRVDGSFTGGSAAAFTPAADRYPQTHFPP